MHQTAIDCTQLQGPKIIFSKQCNRFTPNNNQLLAGAEAKILHLTATVVPDPTNFDPKHMYHQNSSKNMIIMQFYHGTTTSNNTITSICIKTSKFMDLGFKLINLENPKLEFLISYSILSFPKSIIQYN